MSAVNHHEASNGNLRYFEGRRIKSEYQGFQTEILNPLSKIPNKIWLHGNHELWIERNIDKLPNAQGYWEIENNLDLHEWKQIRYGSAVNIGKMYFTHGVYCNEFHAKKTAFDWTRNIFYGHNHSFQVYTKITPANNEPHLGMSIPCACKRNPGYKHNKPDAWLNGFLLFYVLNNGNFNAYPVISTNGNFILNGRVY